MPRSLRFVLVLLLGLSALSVAALLGIQGQMRVWFAQDLGLRARLAVSGARRSLTGEWSHPAALKELLTELVRDERLLAVAACDGARQIIVKTEAYPEELGCAVTAPHFVRLHGVELHVSTFSVEAGATVLGSISMVHDLHYVEDRIASARRFLLLVFGVLTLLAALFTIVVARMVWREWSEELRQALRGRSQRRDFQPLLREVRMLVDRIATEYHQDVQEGNWSPARLRHILTSQLHGERVVILANREPYVHQRTADGGVAILHPASGLVTALEPVMRACSGTWVAHGSGSADHLTVDQHNRVHVPPGKESYFIRRVWLTPEEEKGYYYHFANEGLWPLCHIAHTRPTFSAEDFAIYRRVNQKFADAVCDEVDSDDPIILVQDYHFALAPRMIRQRLPRATILTFWHIPWPNAERFGICPFHAELLEGLLGSSIVGFHTQLYCNNFIDSVDRFLESRIDRAAHAVVQHGGRTLVRAYPISVEWPISHLKDIPDAATCRRAVLIEHGLAPDTLIGVGVDRIDYTKGIAERLLAVERLLEVAPEFRGRFVFIQLGAPSRTEIEQYRELNRSVVALVERINQRFGTEGGYRPIIFARGHHEPSTVFRYLRAADLCYVSSLHDGMNLVAKEFVAAREDERGVLVLSHFTGAASELTEALIVNPYDLDEASAALASALRMSQPEQQARMRAMRSLVSEFNVYRWAGRMLVDAATVRRQAQLRGVIMPLKRSAREPS